MKIIFENGMEFSIADKKVKRGLADGSRPWKNFELYGTVEDAKAAFVEGAVYHKEWESTIIDIDEEGNEITTVEVYTEDLTEWCVPDVIVDHRDGTITVYMGKKTATEILTEAKEEAEAELVAILTLFDAWESGIDYVVGDRRTYQGKLWECRTAHTSQDDWSPGTEATLWAVFSISAGTQDDPIVAAAGMTYELGKHYIEDGIVYKCIRDDTGSGTILHYLPSALVGNYFEIVD